MWIKGALSLCLVLRTAVFFSVVILLALQQFVILLGATDMIRCSFSAPSLKRSSISYIYFGQILGIHFFIWILNVLKAFKSFIQAGTRFQIFAPRLPINTVLYCVECTFILLRCIPHLKLYVLFSTEVNISWYSYFYFKNFFRQLWKVTLLNSYWFICIKEIFKTRIVVIVHYT